MGNAAVQSMVQGQVKAAAAATTAATATVAATIAALPVATTASQILPAAATAAAQAVVSPTERTTDSPATPLWAQAMGQNLPPPIPLPQSGYPPATVYAVNYLSKDLFFKQAEKIYNSIPAHSVAKQDSFGGEEWNIVDALGSVYKDVVITN